MMAQRRSKHIIQAGACQQKENENRRSAVRVIVTQKANEWTADSLQDKGRGRWKRKRKRRCAKQLTGRPRGRKSKIGPFRNVPKIDDSTTPFPSHQPSAEGNPWLGSRAMGFLSAIRCTPLLHTAAIGRHRTSWCSSAVPHFPSGLVTLHLQKALRMYCWGRLDQAGLCKNRNCHQGGAHTL